MFTSRTGKKLRNPLKGRGEVTKRLHKITRGRWATTKDSIGLQEKMKQSGVSSMQGSNEDCLPMKGHTGGGGRTHNVTNTQIFWTKLAD